jgi:O-antigen/teichoic acid export membrane protein
MTTLPTRFRRNAITNYLNQFVMAALAVVVTPILVRGLGKEAFGVWALASASVVFFDLLKFGFGRAAIKYVAESHALNDTERTRKVIATSCAALSVPGLTLLVASPGLAILFGMLVEHRLGTPNPDLVSAAKIFVLISMIDMAVAIPADIFGSTLMGFQRYDLLNISLAATAIAQAASWAAILAMGGGLVAIGVATLTFSLGSQLARYLMVRHLAGGAPLRRRYVDRDLVMPLMSMSGWIAVTDIADFVISRIDTLVVGLIIGIPQAGVYAVGQKLSAFAGRFTSPVAALFFPHASELAAKGDREGLRKTLYAGTRIGVSIATPLVLVLAVLAKPALNAWVGSGYQRAAWVVILLSASTLVATFSRTVIYVLRGLGDVKVPALITAMEAVLNLGLSVGLCFAIGFQGVALGTFIATLIAHFGFILPYGCRRAEASLPRLLFVVVRGNAVPIAATVGLGVFLRVMMGVSGIAGVMAAGAAMMALYALLLFFTGLSGSERRRLIDAVRRRSGAEPPVPSPDVLP